MVEDRCRRVEEGRSNTDDLYRVQLEQQLNQIINLRTDDLGTVSNEIISAYFKNNGRNNTEAEWQKQHRGRKGEVSSQYDRPRHASELQRHPKD